MVKMKKGLYQAPQAQVVLFLDDIIRTSDGSVSGEAVLDWLPSWGGIN